MVELWWPDSKGDGGRLRQHWCLQSCSAAPGIRISISVADPAPLQSYFCTGGNKSTSQPFIGIP